QNSVPAGSANLAGTTLPEPSPEPARPALQGGPDITPGPDRRALAPSVDPGGEQLAAHGVPELALDGCRDHQGARRRRELLRGGHLLVGGDDVLEHVERGVRLPRGGDAQPHPHHALPGPLYAAVVRLETRANRALELAGQPPEVVFGNLVERVLSAAPDRDRFEEDLVVSGPVRLRVPVRERRAFGRTLAQLRVVVEEPRRV